MQPNAGDLSGAPNEPLTLFVCGPNVKCEHDYTGWQDIEGDGTAVCAKCGALAINEAMWG